LTLPLKAVVRAESKGLFIVLLSLFLLSVVTTLQAVEIEGLYRVELPVESQSQNERQRVSAVGLEQVVQRISGDRLAFNEPAVQAALKTPQRYLRQFSYFLGASGQQYLRLQFDESLINRLLRQAKQPIWGSNRPSLMTWVAVEGAGERHLINSDEASLWQRAVKQAGQDSGVPILLPLMDLEDERNISVMDVWGLFRDKLEQASQRYHSEAVLGGRLYQSTPSQWAGRWLLIFNGEAISFSTPPTAIEKSASEAMAKVASIMVKRYAIDTATGNAQQVKLAVQGINNLDDYAQVQRYLQDFTIVRDVAVSDVAGDRLTLAVTTEGEWEKLKGLIALDNRLLPISDAAVEFADGLMVMPYQWRP